MAVDLSKCKAKQHELIEVFRTSGGGPDEEIVVRWCPNCGSIVVDIDYDGRTDPGKVVKMRNPAVTRELLGS